MPQNINLNIPPYNDDFDPSKNYYKVLFKPDDPVQSRELTTLQSILQNQIEKFGQHFFKEGAMVIPGSIGYDSEYTCVEINPVHLGIPVSEYLSNLIGKFIKGETSNVTAKVENVLTDTLSDRNNFTLYIKYQSSSQDNFTTSKFIDGENLINLEDIEYTLGTIRANNTFATTISNNCNSTGSAAKIVDGVYFLRGYFANVPTQTVILDQYSNNPSYRVGLLINEYFATASNEYSDLYDNSQGFSNFAAPGADRLVISAELIKKDINDFNDGNFIQLLSVENGELKKITQTTQYNLIRDELARRTYEESGDYYVKPFDIEVKESLNDYLGNNGIYNQNQQTKQGSTPSDKLACVSISPGKAYVKGYEVETISNSILDLEKTRTTDVASDESVKFNFGSTIKLNNVYGTVPVGYGTDSYIKLFSDRTETVGVSSGTEIGVARVYDLKLKDASYSGAASVYEISLYDIQTYTTIELSSAVPTISLSSYIQGNNSGATGYVIGVNNSTIKLYQVSGAFIKNESVIVNGILDNRIINSVRDYSLNDIHQVTSYNTGISTFTADPVLSRKLEIADNSSFTISSGVSGVSTITTPGNFDSTLNVGDIVSYTIPGNTLPTYNKISSIGNTYKTIEIVGISSAVSGVNFNSLPTSKLDLVTDLKKVTLNLTDLNNGGLYSPLNNKNISNLDTINSSIIVRKSFNINITSVNFETSVLESNTNYKLEPFDEERYNLVYTDGTIVGLNSQNIIPDANTGRITLRNLPKIGNATLTVTYKKINCKTRKKDYQRCTSLIISRTNSGINTTNTGLIYSNVYGIRVEDDVLSLNYPDVTSVIAIYEASNASDPILPSITLNNLSSSITNSIKGEKIIGVTSKAIASLVSHNNSNIADIVYLNENKFELGEEVLFEESKISADIQNYTLGDKNITNSYLFDDGSRGSYLDFSRLIRKKEATSPKRRVKIIFNHYTINSNDDGNFIGVNSYDIERYDGGILPVEGYRGSDILDFRPRVSPYTVSTLSPFEFKSRNFDNNSNSSPDILVNDESTILSYNYYLPRIDKLYLSKDGVFNLVKGIPSVYPKLPNPLDHSLEVATLYLPPYIYNTSEIKIVTNSHKRYTMRDISRLDDRISNVEYYTALSLLETETQNLTITDPDTNLNRFKSGFFVDNFSSYDGGEITNPVYRASVDSSNNRLKPQTYTSYIDLLYSGSSDGVTKVGNVVCLPYTDISYVKNTFATRTENVNPFNVINWIGDIKLNPSTDTWVETNIQSRRVENVEGNYLQTLKNLNADSNTGLSPIQWNAWENTWVGAPVINNSVNSVLSNTSLLTQNTTSGRFEKGRGVPVTVNRTFVDTFTNYTTTTISIPKVQARQGIINKVTERFDTKKVGNVVISREAIHTLRSRNIGILAKRLKPNTRFYGFFDGVDVTSFVVPKLLEIKMISNTFTPGEKVTGTVANKKITFRLAKQNHRYGNILNPTETYTKNPYDLNSTIPSNYSSTSTILNVDTETLELQTESEYYGFVSSGMILTGSTSGATARVNDIQLITDSAGVFIGSLYIPDPTNISNPKFQTGNKTFVLTTSSVNSTISGLTDSTAECIFTASGVLENLEEVSIRLRNADVQRVPQSETRSILNTSSTTVTSTSTNTRTTTDRRYVDPLAQSFEVVEETGIYVTKCDVFFRTKDANSIPITLQIRTMQNGLPTRTRLSQVTLDPKDVLTSDTASVATTFTFNYPIYLEGGNEYCVVLISASDSYNVWISRMGEQDVSTLSLQESERIIVSQQPVLGSLFKSQNGATWDASQYEDLKFNLYRAEFNTNSGTARFENPVLGVGNRQIATLRPNPITTYSKSSQVTLSQSLSTTPEIGSVITQNGNSTFTSVLSSVIGSVGIGSTLSIINVGSGFTSTNAVYSNVDLVSKTGSGSGAKINLAISGGVAIAATISNGGNGYSIGDILTIDYSDVNNLGKDLLITIPNVSGIISSSNSIIIDNIQGSLTLGSGDILINNSVSIGCYPTTETTVIGKDGLHFKVDHNNHGMYSKNNFVTISGIESDISPAKLVTDVTSSSTTISVDSVSNFTTFEGKSVGIGSTGYVLIGDEIIGYESIDAVNNILGGISGMRSIDNTLSTLHSIGDLVFKYEFNGVSLRKINKTHNLADVDANVYPNPIQLDSYYININTNDGVYFKETKTGGSYEYETFKLGANKAPRATQNIMYSTLRPLVNILTPISSEISSKIRTFTATSVSGNEISFVDRGYEDVSLNSNNNFNDVRAIYSRVNEVEYLTTQNKKSVFLDVILSTNNSKVSPMIDLERMGLITVMNRLDDPIVDFTTDNRVNKLYEDPCSEIYVSKVVRLENQADSIKVLFDAYRPESTDIRVAYRIFRNDTPDESQLYELFPGYGNINSRGETLDNSRSNGLPDRLITSSGDVNDFKAYEYNVKIPSGFTGYQIKIMVTGTNQAVIPEIRDLRVIATI